MSIKEMTNIEFARALMEADPSTFKRGYSAENAVLAVKDQRGLSDDEAASLLTTLAKEG